MAKRARRELGRGWLGSEADYCPRDVTKYLAG